MAAYNCLKNSGYVIMVVYEYPKDMNEVYNFEVV